MAQFSVPSLYLHTLLFLVGFQAVEDNVDEFKSWRNALLSLKPVDVSKLQSSELLELITSIRPPVLCGEDGKEQFSDRGSADKGICIALHCTAGDSDEDLAATKAKFVGTALPSQKVGDNDINLSDDEVQYVLLSPPQKGLLGLGYELSVLQTLILSEAMFPNSARCLAEVVFAYTMSYLAAGQRLRAMVLLQHFHLLTLR